MKPIKLIITGSLDFTDDAHFRYEMERISNEHNLVEIICGTENRGINWVAKGWAMEQGIPIKEFAVESGKYGRRAEFVRNEQMAECGTYLYIVWDGRKTRTIQHMINTSLELGLSVSIHNVTNLAAYPRTVGLQSN